MRVRVSAGLVATAALGLAAAMLGGCGDGEPAVRSYTVEKDAEAESGAAAGGAAAPQAATPGAEAGAASAGAGGASAGAASAEAGRPWVVPAGWRELPGERPMRIATFVTGPADGGEEGDGLEVAVTRFPGDVGGLLANVNRWRGQLGVGPVDEAALGEVLEPFENPGYAGYTLRLRGGAQDMLGGIIADEAAGATWVVKAVGPPAAADAHEAAVWGFARSFGAAGGNTGEAVSP